MSNDSTNSAVIETRLKLTAEDTKDAEGKAFNSSASSVVFNSCLPSAHEFIEQFLSQFEHRSVWILTETRFSSAQLNNSLKSFRALTISDAFIEILSNLSQFENNVPLKRLSTQESLLALHGIIASNPGRFPYLFRTQNCQEETPDTGSLSGLKNFIDAVRFCETTEALLKATIDEWGNTESFKSYLEELIHLKDKYQLFLSERNRVDRAHATEMVLEYLNLSRLSQVLRNEVLPDVIILDQPTFIYPLERTLWSRLASFVEMHIVVCDAVLSQAETDLENPEFVPPTLRYTSSLRELLGTHPKLSSNLHVLESRNIDRARLCAHVFDGSMQMPEKCEKLAVWRNDSQREEVSRVVRVISRALRQKLAVASDFHIVCLDLNSYAELITREFRKANIPISIPKGKPLWGCAPAASVVALFEWIENPNPETARDYFGSNIVSKPVFSQTKLANFVDANSALMTEIASTQVFRSVIGKSDWAELLCGSSVLDVWNIYREFVKIGQLGLFSDVNTWAEPILKSYCRKFSAMNASSKPSAQLQQEVNEFISLLKNLVIMDDEIRRASDLKNSDAFASEIGAMLRKRFFKQRVSVREVKSKFIGENSDIETLHEELRSFVVNLRGLRRLFKVVQTLLAFGDEFLESKTHGFKKFVNLYTEHLRSVSISSAVDISAVAVTELLDVRAIRAKHTIVLQATAKLFPVSSASNSQLTQSEVEELSSKIVGKDGSLNKLYEAYWLVSHLFRNSEELVFSYSCHGARGENIAATFVRTLEPFYGVRQAEMEVLEDVPISNVSTNAPLELEKGVRSSKALTRRFEAQFSEYDGLITKDAWRGVDSRSSRSFSAEGVNVYSVSVLEMLADCPHRFFFSRVLGLASKKRFVADEVQSHIGSIVHKALEIFFSRDLGVEKLVTSANFSDSCRQMFRIAEEQFSESEIDWSSHPQLRYAKSRVLEGLQHSDNETAKRGYLKAALVYERDVIRTIPRYVEYQFGLGAKTASPLVIKYDAREVHVRGVVDRIDIEPSEPGNIAAIWDYKTSAKISKLRDVDEARSLQVPLYAAAVGQNLLSEGKYPKRGGLVVLSSPNRRDEFLGSLDKGVAIEHLAAVKRGSTIALDEEAVALRVEKAKSKVIYLDSLVREGNFCQVKETKSCPFCEFRKICYRNVALLDRKLEHACDKSHEAERLPRRPTTTPSLVTTTEGGVRATQLSAEQLLASDISKDISLVAGAGSGKTHVLLTRVIRLILEGESVQSILAITFTEKAASEIRMRIEEAVWKALRCGEFDNRHLSPIERERLIEAGCVLPLVQISTIHSFAARVIAMAPDLSGIGESSRVISGFRQVEFASKAVHSVLSKSAEEDEFKSGRVDKLLSRGILFRSLVTQLLKLVLAPRTLESVLNGLNRDSHDLLEQLVNNASRETSMRVSSVLNDWLPGFNSWYNSEQESDLTDIQREKFSALSDLVQSTKSLLARGSDWQGTLSELMEFLEINKSVAKRKSKKNPRNFWKELNDALRVINTEVINVDLAREKEALRLAREICLIAEESSLAYLELKRSKGVVDFEDLISSSRKILCQVPHHSDRARQKQTILRLRSLFKHIMVDEFQDTDTYQWDIVRVLTGDVPKSNEEKRSLFLVGDSKQAIYGFRGGDVRVFNRASTELLQCGGVVQTLRDNYRSRSEILKFVNVFFDKLFNVDYLFEQKRGISSATRLESMRAKRFEQEPLLGESKAVTFLELDYEMTSALDVSSDMAEAEHTARFIGSVLESIRDSARESEANKWHRLKGIISGPQIAVLSRTAKQLLVMAQALDAIGIPYSVTHSSGYYELEEIIQIENLLRVLNTTSDDISTVGLLRSSFIGLSDREIVEVYTQLDGQWERLFVDESQEQGDRGLLFELTSKFRRFMAFSSVCSASRTLERIVEDCGLRFVYTRMGKDEVFSNIESFIDELRQAELRGESNGSVADALKWLEAQRRDATAARGSGAERPVVLMTIHGSKGLEFSMVILPFLSSRKRSVVSDFIVRDISIGQDNEEVSLLGVKVEDEEADYLRKSTLVSSTLEAKARELDASEERRLFYVACTRARDYLVMSLRHPKSFDSKRKGIEEMSDEKKREALFLSDSPYSWLMHLLKFDNSEGISRWQLVDEKTAEVIDISTTSNHFYL